MSASTTKLLVLLLLTGTLVSAGGLFKGNKTKRKEPKKQEIQMQEYHDKKSIKTQNKRKTCNSCKKKENDAIKVVDDAKEEKIKTNEFTNVKQYELDKIEFKMNVKQDGEKKSVNKDKEKAATKNLLADVYEKADAQILAKEKAQNLLADVYEKTDAQILAKEKAQNLLADAYKNAIGKYKNENDDQSMTESNDHNDFERKFRGLKLYHPYLNKTNNGHKVQPLNETNVATKMIDEMDSPGHSLDESTAASTQHDLTNDDTQSMTELEPLSSKDFKDKKALEEKKSIEQSSNKERERGFNFFAKNAYNTRNQKDTTGKIGSNDWNVNQNFSAKNANNIEKQKDITGKIGSMGWNVNQNFSAKNAYNIEKQNDITGKISSKHWNVNENK